MRRVNDAKATNYEARLTEDLFGDWTLVTAWGGLGSRRGRARSTAVPSYGDGLERIEKIAKHRRQRGYRPVLGSDFDP